MCWICWDQRPCPARRGGRDQWSLYIDLPVLEAAADAVPVDVSVDPRSGPSSNRGGGRRGLPRRRDGGIRDRETRMSSYPSCCRPHRRQAAPPRRASAGGVQLRSDNGSAILFAAARVGKVDKCWSNNAQVCCCRSPTMRCWAFHENLCEVLGKQEHPGQRGASKCCCCRSPAARRKVARCWALVASGSTFQATQQGQSRRGGDSLGTWGSS